MSLLQVFCLNKTLRKQHAAQTRLEHSEETRTNQETRKQQTPGKLTSPQWQAPPSIGSSAWPSEKTKQSRMFLHLASSVGHPAAIFNTEKATCAFFYCMYGKHRDWQFQIPSCAIKKLNRPILRTRNMLLNWHCRCLDSHHHVRPINCSQKYYFSFWNQDWI